MSTQLPFEVEFIEKELVEVNFNILDTIPPIVRKMDDLEDVDLDNLQHHQYLRYNTTTHQWENVTLEAIIEINTVFNELPTKVTTTRFQTAFDFIPNTLTVYFNGIKERYITEVSSNIFDFGIDTEVDDIVEVTYIKA